MHIVGFLAGEVSYHSENETVILPCQKQSYDDIVWLGPPNLTTYAIEETINKKLSKLNRLSIVHSNINSTYNLKIRYFSIDDEGLYKCVRTVHLPDSQQIYFDLKKTSKSSGIPILALQSILFISPFIFYSHHYCLILFLLFKTVKLYPRFIK